MANDRMPEYVPVGPVMLPRREKVRVSVRPSLSYAEKLLSEGSKVERAHIEVIVYEGRKP